jgi:surfactin synthase thioesterase subunit
MFPFAGGNAGLYADWTDEVPDVSVKTMWLSTNH